MHGSMNAAYRDHMLTKKGPWEGTTEKMRGGVFPRYLACFVTKLETFTSGYECFANTTNVHMRS